MDGWPFGTRRLARQLIVGAIILALFAVFVVGDLALDFLEGALP